MRVYLATAFPKAAELAIPYAARLEAAGIGITCKWWDQPSTGKPETELLIEEQRGFADKDLAGVEDANLVWVLSPGATGGTGCWFEMGYAHALKKLVVISGHSRTIFAARRGVERFTEHDAALEWITNPGDPACGCDLPGNRCPEHDTEARG